MKKKIIFFLCYLIIAFVNKRIGFINIPDSDKMVDFQFNLFTVSTVLAGFSFTVLGILMGMYSEQLIEKIKETSIVTRKSEHIENSIFWFCVSCIIAILYVTGIINFTGLKFDKVPINDYMFTLEVLSCLIGFVYFLLSVHGVYSLIKKVFGHNKKEAKKRKKDFDNEIERLKKDTH